MQNGLRGLVLLCAALVVGCGDDVAFSASGSTGGAGGEGGALVTASTGEGGMGGGSPAGGFGGMPGTGGSDGGYDGAGGDAGPMCPAPTCPTSGIVVNCDPGCGAVAPGCASCVDVDTAPPVELGHGETELRIAALAGQLPECGACSTAEPPWWDMRLKLPLDVGCIVVDGPDEMRIAVASNTPPAIPSLCTAGGGLSGCFSGPISVAGIAEPWLILTLNEPVADVPADGGATVRITVSAAATCAPAKCNGGCNGAGD